jgi:predicted Zn-ribbon and HTH transcriptional regulator
MQDILSGRYKQSRMKGMAMVLTPEDIANAVKTGKYLFKKGLSKFDEWSKKMVEDWGEEIKPELPKIWAAINKKEEAKSPVKAQEDPAPLGPLVSYAAKGQLTVPDVIWSRKIQRIAFWTVIIVIGMCLFPPWTRYSYSVREGIPHKWQISSKYAFLFTPPEVIESEKKGTTALIDIRRLLVQCVFVILAGGAFFFYRQHMAKIKLIADKQNSNQEMVIINKNLLEKTVENTYTETEKLPIICPHCQRKLFGATRAMVGDTGICPKCKAEFIIEEKKC